MEKKSLKTYKTWAIVLAVVTMVLGLVMVFWPGISAVAICSLMGAVCIAAGIYEIIRYFDLGLIGVLFRYDLFLGIMSVLAGIFLIFYGISELISMRRVSKAKVEYEIRYNRDNADDDDSVPQGLGDVKDVDYHKVDDQ